MDRSLARMSSAAEPSTSLWQRVPLECIATAVAIVLAAGLKLAGFMP